MFKAYRKYLAMTEETMNVPAEIFRSTSHELAAIDWGGSLIKVVTFELGKDRKEYEAKFRVYTHDELDDVLKHIIGFIGNEASEKPIHVTGIHILPHAEKIMNTLSRKLEVKDEFTCFQKTFGVLSKYLPKQEMVIEKDETTLKRCGKNLHATYNSFKVWQTLSGMKFRQLESSESDICNIVKVDVDPSLPYAEADKNLYPCLLAQIGSGGVIYRLDADGTRTHVSYNPLAGRTILGLSALLTGVKSFTEVMKLTEKGDNKKLDNLLSDFQENDDMEDDEANVYDTGMNFGDLKLYTMGLVEGANNEDFSKEDILSSSVGMLLESIADWIDCHARREKVQRVFMAGSVIGNLVARNLLTKHLEGKMLAGGKELHVEYNFLKQSSYYGCLGALFTE